MRKRLVVFMAVSVMLGLLPLGRAEAGPFIKHYQVVCKITLGGPLTYPAVTNPGPTPWSIACGKDKNQSHPVAGVDETFCQMVSASANGKKALKTKPLPPGPAGKLKGSNCNITGGGLVLPVTPPGTLGPNCGFSQGEGTITISNNTDKSVVVDIEWPPTVGGVLPIVASAPAKPAVGFGAVAAVPDTIKKGESCLSGADQFKVAGTLYLFGNKAKE